MGTRQMGISRLNERRQRVSHRVQIGDSRTGDAGGIAQLQRMSIRQLVTDASLRHPVVQMFSERLTFPVRIATLHVAVFIA